MGKRTSVYLSDKIEAAVKASGVPLAELVKRGLGTQAPRRPGITDTMTGQLPVTATLSSLPQKLPADCPHRGLRPGAYCRSCDSTVPERGKR